MDVGRSLTGTETASNLLLIKSGVRRCDRHGIIATSMTIPLQSLRQLRAVLDAALPLSQCSLDSSPSSAPQISDEGEPPADVATGSIVQPRPGGNSNTPPSSGPANSKSRSLGSMFSTA